MAIIPFLQPQPESKTNELSLKIQSYIDSGKYVSTEEDKTLMQGLEREISFLPEKYMQDFCHSVLFCATGDVDNLKKLADDFLKNPQNFHASVMNSIIYSLITIGEFSYAGNYIASLWGRHRALIVNHYMIGYIISSLNYSEMAMEILRMFDNFDSNDENKKIATYLKSILHIIKNGDFDLDGGVKMLDIAGKVLKKHELFNSGLSVDFDSEDILNLTMKINTDIDKYLALNDELSDFLYHDFPDHPSNIVVGFWPVTEDDAV